MESKPSRVSGQRAKESARLQHKETKNLLLPSSSPWSSSSMCVELDSIAGRHVSQNFIASELKPVSAQPEHHWVVITQHAELQPRVATVCSRSQFAISAITKTAARTAIISQFFASVCGAILNFFALPKQNTRRPNRPSPLTSSSLYRTQGSCSSFWLHGLALFGPILVQKMASSTNARPL